MNLEKDASNTTFDFLVVGQGIAGTLLTHFLLKEGKKVMVIDVAKKNSPSNTAAGVINPITGRRYVKSWKFEELLPFAQQTYQNLEKEFQLSLYKERNIIRTLFNHREENDWLARHGDISYQPYLIEEADLGEYKTQMVPAFAYGEIQGSIQVNIGALVRAYRIQLKEQGLLQSERFNYTLLKQQEQGVQYKAIKAKQLLFCEGSDGIKNPYFNYLPFNLAKGEVLIVRIRKVHFEKLLKHRIFIVPLEDDLYWIGSTYDWDFKDDLPTTEGKNFLKERLGEVLNHPFEIIEHRAAIRPTVKDRRPFLGLHPKFPHLGIFNGLGTKGASLGPYFAKQMCDFLIGKVELDPKVNINRFEKN